MILALNSRPTLRPWKPSAANLSATYHLIKANPFIPSNPTYKQLCFLSYPGLEAMYGGAGGGGKSEALLMAAAMYAEYPDHSTLILRRTFAELIKPGALIDRAKQWWLNNPRVRWNSQEKQFTFPSGAKVTFGHLENEDSKYQYQSAEYQTICFDELTEFTESMYRFLFSRLRKSNANPLPLRMRSATNPGGRGHAWVKSRFITSPEGRRRFFPARLGDNPHIDQEQYRRSLSELDPLTRRQIEEGDWTDPEGGRFKRDWFRFYSWKNGYGYFLVDGELLPYTAIHNKFLTTDHASTVAEIASTKKKDDPDWTVCSSWGLTPKMQLIWLGCARKRIEVPDIPPLVAHEYLRWGVDKARMESGGTQKGVPQLCRRHRLPDGRAMNIVEVQPKGDKLERSVFAQNMMEAGRVLVPDNDPTFPLEDVITEILAFTGDDKQDAHDDIVDTLSDAAWAIDAKVERKVHKAPAPIFRSRG